MYARGNRPLEPDAAMSWLVCSHFVLSRLKVYWQFIMFTLFQSPCRICWRCGLSRLPSCPSSLFLLRSPIYVSFNPLFQWRDDEASFSLKHSLGWIQFCCTKRAFLYLNRKFLSCFFSVRSFEVSSNSFHHRFHKAFSLWVSLQP